MNIGWVYHEEMLKHRPEDVTLPEQPERLEIIHEALQDAGLLEQMNPLPFDWARPEQLTLVHEPAYVELVRMACEEGFGWIGSRETQICSQSYEAALRAVGGVTAACDAAMAGQATRTFCAVRPPGHHAESDRAMGFCLFNNVAIGAAHLTKHCNLERVAVVDIDVHHGNGTQQMFEGRSDVLYISLHERPGSLPFPGSGLEAETGTGTGEGYTLNIPLTMASGDAVYRACFAEKVIPALNAFRPQFLLMSTGFDAVRGDLNGHLCLEPSSFEWMTRALVEVADAHAGGRLVSVLEGGYDYNQLGACAVAHVSGLAN